MIFELAKNIVTYDQLRAGSLAMQLSIKLVQSSVLTQIFSASNLQSFFIFSMQTSQAKQDEIKLRIAPIWRKWAALYSLFIYAKLICQIKLKNCLSKMSRLFDLILHFPGTQKSYIESKLRIFSQMLTLTIFGGSVKTALGPDMPQSSLKKGITSYIFQVNTSLEPYIYTNIQLSHLIKYRICRAKLIFIRNLQNIDIIFLHCANYSFGYLIVHLLYSKLINNLIDSMNNKSQSAINIEPKLIVIDPDELLQTKASSNIFRSWKKPIKTFNINSTPRFIDHNLIKAQLKDWVHKMNDHQKQDSNRHQKINTSTLSSKKLYQIINQIREDEKIILRDMSSDSKGQKASNPKLSSSIKINLQQVQKMKCTIENSKVILSPRDFQINLTERPATNFGYRPIQSRFEKHFNSKKNLMKSHHQRKRCFTERKEMFTIDSFEKYVQSPTTPLSTSKAGSHYQNRSKMKKIWETMGLHEWSNVN